MASPIPAAAAVSVPSEGLHPAHEESDLTRNALIKAVLNVKMKEIAALLNANEDTLPQNAFVSALHIAAEKGVALGVGALLRSDVFMERCDGYELACALNEAAAKGHVECVNKITSSEYFRNKVIKEFHHLKHLGKTLQLVARRGHSSVVRALFERRELKQHLFPFLIPTLFQAVSYEEVDVVQTLLELIPKSLDGEIGKVLPIAITTAGERMQVVRVLLASPRFQSAVDASDVVEALKAAVSSRELFEMLFNSLFISNVFHLFSKEECGHILIEAVREAPDIQIIQSLVNENMIMDKVSEKDFDEARSLAASRDRSDFIEELDSYPRSKKRRQA